MIKGDVKQKMREFGIPDERIVHGEQVCDLALKIAEKMERKEKVMLNRDHLIAGAIVHDAGFTRLKGKPITINMLGMKEFTVQDDVVLHGMYGAEIAAEMGYPKEVELIILRHELIAITREERAALGILPLPDHDVVPETWEEKAVMYADGLQFLAVGLGLDLWQDAQAPAKGFYDILKATTGHLSKEPVTLDHPVLKRSNRLNEELKEYAEPSWVGL